MCDLSILTTNGESSYISIVLFTTPLVSEKYATSKFKLAIVFATSENDDNLFTSSFRLPNNEFS